MPDTSTAAAASSSVRRQDVVLAVGLLALTAAVFWPAAHWLTSQTFAHEQLKQSFLIVVLAGGWIAWEQRKSLRLSVQFSNGAIAALFIAYAFAGAAIWLKSPLLVLAGLVAALGGIVACLFGDRAFRRTVPLLTVFALLILCVLLFPILDWPLRRMAGVEAVRLLKAVGLASQLAVTMHPEPRLLLLTGTQTFVVETECNGFGLITSSLLLGTILLLYRRAPAWRYALLLPLCAAVAFVFNLLRIASIVILAPRFPGHYHAMHETLGLIALYGGLALVWWLTGRKQRTEGSAEPAH